MIKDLVEPLAEVTDRLEKWYQLRKSVETQLRLLYLECRKNIELLRVAELDYQECEAHTDDPDYLEMAELLEVPVLQMVFLDGKSNHKLYELLRKLTLPLEINGDSKFLDKQNNQDSEYNAIQACVYLYVKTATLQKLARMKHQGKGLHKVYYRARLKNIYVNFINLVKMLSSHKEIQQIIGDQFL